MKHPLNPSFYLDTVAAVVIPGSPSQQPLKIHQPHSAVNLSRFSFDKYHALYEPQLLTRIDRLGRLKGRGARSPRPGLHSRRFDVSIFYDIFQKGNSIFRMKRQMEC
jgi:hypothetical protein